MLLASGKKESSALALSVVLILGVDQSCRTAEKDALQPAPVAPSSLLPAGIWGGDHLELLVSADGAQAEFDCAHGTITPPLDLDPGGSFNLAGTYVQEHGGPQGAGQQADSHPAKYSGITDGTTMTLTVTLTDTQEEIGTYKLALGQPPHITRCL